MDFMSEEAARNWCKNAKGSYDLSIEKFVSLVKEYCEKKGPNHHVIFLVDEIGQYIADDTQLPARKILILLQKQKVMIFQKFRDVSIPDYLCLHPM